MKKYYLSKRSLLDGYFPVHKENCPFLSDRENRIDLGEFDNCYKAVKKAQSLIFNSDGCFYCNKRCSKSRGENLRDWKIPFNMKIVFSEN
jgi:thioredoxin-related protein